MNATVTRNFFIVATLIASALSLVPVYALSLGSPLRDEVRTTNQQDTPQDGSIVINGLRPSRPIP
jgi:hypothetical protein